MGRKPKGVGEEGQDAGKDVAGEGGHRQRCRDREGGRDTLQLEIFLVSDVRLLLGLKI